MADGEGLGSLGCWLITCRVTGHHKNQNNGLALGLVAGRRIVSGCTEASFFSGKGDGIWGRLSGEYLLPHVEAVRIALRPELAPLPGHGCTEWMGWHTHVSMSQVPFVLAQQSLRRRNIHSAAVLVKDVKLEWGSGCASDAPKHWRVLCDSKAKTKAGLANRSAKGGSHNNYCW